MSEVELTYRANAFQSRVYHALQKNKRITACFAGWRTGKTDFLGLEHVIRRQMYGNPDVLHLLGANTYAQLVDSTLRPLFAHLDRLGVPHVPDQLPRAGRPFSLMLWNDAVGKWVEFLCRSMDNFDTVAGVTLGSAWLDEVWDTEKWTFDLALSRLSDKRSRILQLVISTTKDDPEHWTYRELVERVRLNEPDDTGRRPSDDIEIVEGRTEDNRINLIDGYIETQRATISERLFRRFILNEWISVSEAGLAYDYFVDEDYPRGHILERGYRPDVPLILALDFNIAPCVWELGQDWGGITNYFDEIRQSPTDVWKMANEAKRRIVALNGGKEEVARRVRLEFYGDYTSTSRRDATATADAWGILRDEFRGWNAGFNLRPNPRVVDRVHCVQSRLRSARGDIRLTVSRQCAELIKDFKAVTMEMLRSEKASAGDRTHASDAVGYRERFVYPILGAGGSLEVR